MEKDIEKIVSLQNVRMDRLCRRLEHERNPIFKKVYMQQLQKILGDYEGSREDWTTYTSKMMKYIMEK